uniref:Uncharacterized protein n=1 Tax=Nelumbo nucifera TaxID=4432 RepID=A0A822Y681_NELNU|nr:TPA_asm: hypothetical protein HUJ06_028144 [Nelumbo nucifera]
MSLKLVANWKCIIHHQVLKIREEDSHFGEDIAKGLKEKLAIQNLTSQMDRFMIARPTLPCSPLSGKTVVLH